MDDRVRVAWRCFAGDWLNLHTSADYQRYCRVAGQIARSRGCEPAWLEGRLYQFGRQVGTYERFAGTQLALCQQRLGVASRPRPTPGMRSHRQPSRYPGKKETSECPYSCALCARAETGMSEVTVLPWSELEEEFAGTGSPGCGGALLLGNGFSQNIWSGFGYHRLLDCSGLTGVARELFGDRTNFETVLSELAVTERVLGIAASDHTEIGEQLRELAAEVRDGLRAAVDNVHPELRDLVVEEPWDGSDGFKRRVNVIPDRVEDYLCRHSSIFTTNYDLLSYWPVVSGRAADLFPGGDPFDLARAVGWATYWSSAIYFLHGSLFLWRDLAEAMRKASTWPARTPTLS